MLGSVPGHHFNQQVLNVPFFRLAGSPVSSTLDFTSMSVPDRVTVTAQARFASCGDLLLW